MHKRTRDWGQLAHVCRVYLDGYPTFQALPEEVKQEAYAMRDLWNRLVDLWDENSARYQSVVAQMEEVQQCAASVDAAREVWRAAADETKKAKIKCRMKTGPTIAPLAAVQREKANILKAASEKLKAARMRAREELKPQLQALSEKFWQSVRATTREDETYWGNTELVQQGFESCLKRFFKGIGGTPKKKAGPITDIRFRHRFTQGGMKVERLFKDLGRVFVSEQPPPQAYAKGRSDSLKKKLARVPGGFKVRDQVLPFRIMLHRPLPRGAFIKTATLIGERTQRQYYHSNYYQANWRYHVVFSLEIPDDAYYRKSTAVRTSAAIDLGWRVWDDRIRFGFLVDSAGRRRELFLPPYILSDWKFCKEMQEKASRSIDEMRAQFIDSIFFKEREWEQLPEEHHPLFTHIAQSKGPGIPWKLLDLELKGLIPGDHFQTWARAWSGFDRQRQGVHGRLVRARNHFYRELSNSLCQEYGSITIEKLNLAELAEKGSNQLAIELSQQYRQLTSLSSFISFLKQSGVRWRSAIEEREAAFTTTTCYQCGAKIKNTGKLFLECDNGHVVDQDENSARNLSMPLSVPVAIEPQMPIAVERMAK